MDKEVSIVLSVERKNHRKLAQEWYGLTDEQMIDMDVHHNPPRHKGGRNIPEHLFVYHSTLHTAVHGDTLTAFAREGGRLGAEKVHSNRDKFGRSQHSMSLHNEKDDLGRSIIAVRGAEKAHVRKDEFGKSITAMKAGKAAAKKLHAERDEFGRSKHGLRSAKTWSAPNWMDPNHPELGTHNAGNLVKIQKSKGLPHGPENRRRVQ